MNDHELSHLLQETCPVLPGQEARAWKQLQERRARPARPLWLRWQPLLASGAGFAVLLVIAVHVATPVIEPVSAASQSPGVFATAFYSQPAHAQVVWLNGLDPASDGPTSMDRSGQVDDHATKPDDSL
jgi:hypothetical protein